LETNAQGVVAATSTFPASGIFGILGVANGGTGAATITGLLEGNGASAIAGVTGTAGQLPYYNGTNTLLATSSLFIAANGNVGIGTTGPAVALDVVGDVLSRNSGNTNAVFMDSNGGTYGRVQSMNAALTANTNLALQPQGGNVGIGTTGPKSPLHIFAAQVDPNLSAWTGLLTIQPSSAGYGTLQIGSQAESPYGAWVQASNYSGGGSGTASPLLLNPLGGNVGIGTTGPNGTLDVEGSNGVILNAGNVGIGNTTPSAGLSVISGFSFTSIPGAYLTVGHDSSTAGGQPWMAFSYNGSPIGSITQNLTTGTNYNTTSDRRLKENIATTTIGLATLLQIPVDNFDFIKDPSHTPVQGFIAQSLAPIYPEAVTTNGDNGVAPLGPTSTPWSVDYGRITPLIVAAVQDIANITSTFEQNLIAWLGNAANGIHDLYATIIHSQEDDTQKLCVGSTCVTPAQFQAMVAAANQTAAASASPSASTSSATDTPPVIAINGDNPAIVQVGATYSDLGATITGPQADLNLGIKTFVNGLFASNIQIDTSAVATDTIDYVATDQNGLTSTSSRTVIVEAANDNSASTTVATSTAQ
jgi:hypothetical protein